MPVDGINAVCSAVARRPVSIIDGGGESVAKLPLNIH